MSRQKKLINKTNYPQHAIEKFARCVYPDIVAFYQSEEGQREFAEWQAEQAAKKAQRKLHTTKKEVTAAVTSVVILWAFSSVGLLAWKWEECGSRWGSRLARIARNKQIIRTRPRLGRTGSDYIGLVRERGLEPPRDYHTHLKRACLPFQHSRKCLDIVSYFPCFVNPFLRNGTVGFPRNRVAVSGNRLPFISGFPLLRKQGIHNGRNHTAVGDEHRIPIQELRKRP